MDWQGQKVAEQLMQILLLSFAAAAFVTGYLMRSFQLMMLIYAGGVLLTALVTVPNWPCFNRRPLQWLDPSEADKHPKPQPAPVASKKKQPSKKLLLGIDSPPIKWLLSCFIMFFQFLSFNLNEWQVFNPMKGLQALKFSGSLTFLYLCGLIMLLWLLHPLEMVSSLRSALIIWCCYMLYDCRELKERFSDTGVVA